MSLSTPLSVLDDRTALDRFTATRLPFWLKSASPEHIEKLQGSLELHQTQQTRVAELLQSLQPIEAFARERLDHALRAAPGGAVESGRVHWRDVRLRVEQPPFRVTESDLPVFRLMPRDSDLLQRVLLNFTQGQANASYYYPGAGMVQDGRVLNIPPEWLAATCRQLDLGSAYQSHLDSVLQPADETARQQVLHLLAEDRRCTLRAQVYRSHLLGHIDVDALAMFEDMLEGTGQTAYTQRPLRCRSLEVLGFPVPEALVFETRGESLPGAIRWYDASLTRQVILYIPNDPRCALRQQPSWHQLGSELAEDLKDPEYQAFFMGQLRHDDRLGFLQRLLPRLEDPRPELEMVGLPSERVTFGSLVLRQIQRIKSDAASLIVSTADTDQSAHQQRVRALEDAGLSVIGLAASFLPGVGQLMLANLAWDTLKDLYEGVQDWTHGQRAEALEHFLGVARNLTVSTAVAGTTALGIRALRRSAFVDGLRPIVRADGGERLWSTDLQPYRSPLPGVGEVAGDGLIHARGRRWWRREGQVYEVGRLTPVSVLRLVHSVRRWAYAPPLLGNNGGAWWIQGEHPLEWRDLIPLLRRFGPPAHQLSDEARNLAVGIAGYDEATMRGLLVEQRPAPPALALALQHSVLDAAIDRFFEQLPSASSAEALDPVLCSYLRRLPDGQARPRSAELALWKARSTALRYALFDHAAIAREPVLDHAAEVLRRGFPALPAAAAQTLVDEARASHQLTLTRDGRIPLALNERALMHVREARVAAAVEGLCLNNVYRTDTVRLVFALLRRLPAWPAGLNIELREGGLSSAPLERLLGPSQTLETRVLVREDGLFEVFDSATADRSQSLAPAGSLYQAILTALGQEHCRTLGWDDADAAGRLHGTLREAALSERQRLAGLLGLSGPQPSFRDLQEGGRGQRGYLLSGRGRLGQSTLSNLVRTLYPGFDDAQVDAFLLRLQAEHADPMGELLRCESSLLSLEQTLNRWQQQATPFSLNSRRRVADEICRCWRRQTSQVFAVDGSVMGYRLNLGHVAIGDLPELPGDVDFSHVVDLNMPEAGQTQQVDGFLRRFVNLRWLDLSGNGLTDMPAALSGMPELRELVMDGNRIRLSDSGAQVLSSLGRLEVLYLDRNPLGRSPDLRPLNHLRRLSMRRTGLLELPAGLLTRGFLEMADLRGNAMETLPDGFFTSSARMRDATLLQGNPFLQAVRSRLWEVLEQGEGTPAEPASAVTRQRWLESAEGDQLEGLRTQWDNLVAEESSTPFFNLLNSLLASAEFRHAADDLRVRVWRMVQAMAENTELRENLFDLAASPATCVDSVSSNFSVLEVRFLLFQTSARSRPGQKGAALLHFARRLFRLDRLERIAREDIETRESMGRGVDDVEVSLAYRVGLARELDLPGQPGHMQFSEVAGVSQRNLREAAAAVRAAEAGEELTAFIATRDFWLAWLREQRGDAFSELEADFWTRLDGLAAREASMPEGDYLNAMNRLASERDAALEGLARRLTEDALRDTAVP